MKEHTSTIGQQLGAKTGHGDLTHATIPENKRGRAERDGHGKRFNLMAYVKEHNGEIIKHTDVAHLLGEHSSSEWSNYSRQLEKMGKITRVKEGGLLRIFIGKQPKPHENGPVIVKQPAAPVKRSQLDVLNEQAWAYIRSQTNVDATRRVPLALMVITIDGFLKELEGKLERPIEPVMSELDNKEVLA